MSIAVAIGLTSLTSLAVALLLLPLLARRHHPRPREAYNLAVYRDQLAEISAICARPADRGNADRPAEIGRRILALDEAEPPLPADPKKLALAVVGSWRCRSRRC